MFFSIFVMNIFIGVISEQYSNEKQQVNLMFQSLRVPFKASKILFLRAPLASPTCYGCVCCPAT